MHPSGGVNLYFPCPFWTARARGLVWRRRRGSWASLAASAALKDLRFWPLQQSGSSDISIYSRDAFGYRRRP
jgi:hypothetical protein